MTLTRTLLQSPTLGAFPERIVDGLPLDLANRVAKGDLLINVQDSPYNAVGDVVALSDVILLAGSAVPVTSHVFTNADVNKSFLVAGAGQAFVDRGAWAPSTAYVRGDKVTFGGQTFVATSSFTSSAFAFGQTNWMVPDPGQAAYSLEATILSVTGGVPTLSTPAITPVSGVQAWFGTDESTAFQAATDAANAAGGGNVYVPQPKVGTAYIVQNVFITAGVHLWTAPGVHFRLPATPATSAQVFTLGSKVKTAGVWSDFCGIHGPMVFDLTGINQGRLSRGLIVTNPRHFHIEDLDCSGAAEGSTVHLSTTSVFTYPIHGTIERISCTNGPFGYGAVQVAGGKQLVFDDIWADGGIALRIEVDTQPSGCVVEDITASNLYAEAVAGKPASANAALALVAHGNQVRNINVEGLRATGGADLITFNYVPTNPASLLDHIRITGGLVDGGGCGTTTNGTNDLTFTDFHVKDVIAVGTLAPAWRYTGVGTSTTSRNDAFYHAGMLFENCHSIGAAGVGWKDIFQTVSTAVTSWFRRCRGYKNTGYGSYIQGSGTTVVYEDCDFGDDPTFQTLGAELLTSALLDAQCGTAATQWTTGAGASAAARDTGHVYSGGGAASVAITADGTQNWAITHSPIGLSGFAVTAGHYYKAIAAGQAQGTPKSVGINIWWYDSSGAFIGATNGAPATEVAGQWTVTATSGQAPVGAARAAMLMEGVDTAHLTVGEVHNLVPLHFAEVAGIATQSYGLYTATGAASILCRTTLANNGAGRTAGPGTVTEYQPIDAGVTGAVSAHHATHQPGGTDPIDFTTVNLTGTTAAMPAASAANAGLLYWASDSNGGAWFRSTGSAWVQVTKGLTAPPAAHHATHEPGGADAIAAQSIDWLSDVDTTSSAPTTNQDLKWNGTLWVPGDVIRPATLTAKGDRYIATASGVVVREPAGNDGTYKIARSAGSQGIASVQPMAAVPRAGAYLIPAGQANAQTVTLLNSSPRYSPIFIPVDWTFVQMGIWVTTAGAGTAPVIRFGIFNPTSDLWPDTLQQEVGSAACTSSGAQCSVTASIALTAGWWMLMCVAQGCTVTNPVVAAVVSTSLCIPSTSAPTTTGTGGWTSANQTGTPLVAATSVASATIGPFAWLKG